MKKRSLLLTTLSLFVVLSVSTVFFIQSFLKPEHLKNLLQQQFSSHTGRTLSINGDIKWHLFPWIGLELTKVDISNPPPFSNMEKKFATIKELGITLKLSPLLHGQYEVANVYVNGCQLGLLKSWQVNNFNFKASNIKEDVFSPIQFSFSLLNNKKDKIDIKYNAIVKINVQQKKFDAKQIDAKFGETRLTGNFNYENNNLAFDLSADRINTDYFNKIFNVQSEQNKKTSSHATPLAIPLDIQE